MPFLPWRKIAFPTFWVLRDTHYSKVLAWRSFFSCNMLWGCDHREGPQTHTERQTNIQKSVPSRILSRRVLVSLGPYGKFLDPAGTHPECEPRYWTLVAKFGFFSWWALKWCGLATAWKSIQLMFSYFCSASFAPPFWISEASGQVTIPHRRPVCRGMSPWLGDHRMSPSTLTLLQHASSCVVVEWLRKCLQVLESAGRHPEPTLEVRSSEKAWRPHV